jgi:hypothetical protein
MITHAQYERSLAKAHAEGLEIAAHGYRKDDGSRVVGVTSASQPNTVHMVTILDLQLACSCPAGQHEIYCKHRALVREHLIQTRYARSDARLARAEQDLHQVAVQLITR